MRFLHWLWMSLKLWWYKSDGKWRKECSDNQRNIEEYNALCWYNDLSSIIVEMIQNSADVLGLQHIRHPSQVVPHRWYHVYPCGVWALCYRCRYTPHPDSDKRLSAKDFSRVLQQELIAICNYYAIPWQVVAVKLSPDRVAHIRIVPYQICYYYLQRKRDREKCTKNC